MHHYRRSIANLVRAEVSRHVTPASILDVQLLQADALYLTIVLRASVGLDGGAMLALGRRLRAILPANAGLPQITFRLQPDPGSVPPDVIPTPPAVALAPPAPLLAAAARLIGVGLRPTAVALANPTTRRTAKWRGKPSPSAPSQWVG
jgi:hypothetical protein